MTLLSLLLSLIASISPIIQSFTIPQVMSDTSFVSSSDYSISSDVFDYGIMPLDLSSSQFNSITLQLQNIENLLSSINSYGFGVDYFSKQVGFSYFTNGNPNTVQGTLAQFFNSLSNNMTLQSNSPYLNTAGTVTTSTFYLDMPNILDQGFLGLASILRGPPGNAGTILDSHYSGYLVSTSLDSSQTYKQTYETYGGFPMIQLLLEAIQHDTGSLAFVLANDDDEQLKQQEKPNQDAFEDGFLGSGSGSTNVSDIGSLASASGDLKGALKGEASAGQGLDALLGGDGWGFWSQQVQDDLNPQFSTSRYTRNDDGFVYFYNSDSFSDYLEANPE